MINLGRLQEFYLEHFDGHLLSFTEDRVGCVEEHPEFYIGPGPFDVLERHLQKKDRYLNR